MKSDLDLPAPPAPPSGGDEGSEWIHLTRAANDIDAHLLTGRLAEAGIETRLVKDRGVPGSWLYGGSNPWAPVTVLVRRYQYDDARLVLAEIAFDASDAPPPPPRGRKFSLAWWAAVIVLGVVLTLIGLLRSAETLREASWCVSAALCPP